MGLTSHPLRDAVVAEFHLRPPPPISVPCQLFQITRLVDPEERAAERAHLALLPDFEVLDSVRRYVAATVHGIPVGWERHSEGSTSYIVLSPAQDQDTTRQMLDWLEAMPGRIMRATRVELAANDKVARQLVNAARLKSDELVGGKVGPINFWSDFRIQQDGYGLVIVAANGCHPADLARRVQQLQELGNYRNLALLGLTVAREGDQALRDIERDLADLTGHLHEPDGHREVLDALASLAGQTAALRSAHAYRLGATAAYGEIVEDRLLALSAQPIDQLMSLDEFTERRLLPALRTCTSYLRRLEDAASGIERAASMLRTRIKMQLAEQNLAIMASLKQNVIKQTRLQHLVEGFSIVALSYYAIALLELLLTGTGEMFELKTRPEEWAALAIFPTLAGFWLILEWRKRRALRRPLED